MSVRSGFPILYSKDIAPLVAFYRDHLGFDKTFQFPPEGEPVFVSLDTADAHLAIALVDADHPPAHGLPALPRAGLSFELCLYIDDLEAQVERLRGVGVPIPLEPRDMPWGERIAYAVDPDGNPILLIQHPGE